MEPKIKTFKQQIGSTVAEWKEDTPLCWTMSEAFGKGKNTEIRQHHFDLTPLLSGYTIAFLLALKEHWIERRLHVTLFTIYHDASKVRKVLECAQRAFEKISGPLALPAPMFNTINSDFLLGLSALQQDLPQGNLIALRGLFKTARHNIALFAPNICEGDFPMGLIGLNDPNNFGTVGKLRKNILATALSRATLVHILNVTEQAFEMGELNLDRFAYSRLMLSRALRPESFRVLRLKDLRIEEINGRKEYFLAISIPKTKMADRPIATVRLPIDVGMILNRQRDSVAKRLGYLIERKNSKVKETVQDESLFTIGDLPLFPAYESAYMKRPEVQDRLGMAGRVSQILSYYLRPLKKVTQAKMNHIALRHTLGTQLAIVGCGSSTIAAVLLHAGNRTASVYVDLIFSGAIDKLSDALEPAFLEHFPVIDTFVSKDDEIDPKRKIVSSSTDRLRRELNGECGRHQICQHAPIACYDCYRFKPCYDVDHSINLDRINEEIEAAQQGGLPRQTDVKRYQHIANRIRVVIMICEAKYEAIKAENIKKK